MLAKKDLLVCNTTSFIAYGKTVYKDASGIRYVVACLLKFLKLRLPTSACLIVRVADKLIKQLSREKA